MLNKVAIWALQAPDSCQGTTADQQNRARTQQAEGGGGRGGGGELSWGKREVEH